MQGLSASEPAGQRVLGPLTIQGTVVIGDTVTGGLSQGDNTTVVPAGAIGVVIIPPSTGSATLKYRTNLNGADAGLPISASSPSVHVFPSPAPTSIILNASGSQAAFTSLWFW